jgi:hypothetical protein
MLRPLDATENQELRDFFQESGYDMHSLQKYFGSVEIPQLHLLKLYLLGIPLEPSRLSILLRWFWISLPVEPAAAREFIPERMIELFLKAGLLIVQEDNLVSIARLTPFLGFLVFSDHAVAKDGHLRTDTVLWPNPSTLLCYHLSVQHPVGRTLDLGTGNGILALAAASHSGSVVATDLNPRARDFCLFNAALNGLNNIEFREGSAFEPVRGERFDLILANPPFFVTPSVRRIFSDNSMELDGFCRMLVRESPEYLNDNGYFQLLVEWVEVYGQPWQERLGEWFEDLGCDAWVLASYARSAADYSLIRVQESRDEMYDPMAQATQTNQWQSYFEDHRVKTIFGGVITLRKRQGRNWTQMEELKTQPVRPFGEYVRRRFENLEVLEKHGAEEDMLAMRPQLHSSAWLQQLSTISPEGWQLTSMELHLSEGLPVSLALQPQVAAFVALCDGKRTLEEAADLTATAVGADPVAVRRECCAVIRRLADRGMVRLSA